MSAQRCLNAGAALEMLVICTVSAHSQRLELTYPSLSYRRELTAYIHTKQQT